MNLTHNNISRDDNFSIKYLEHQPNLSLPLPLPLNREEKIQKLIMTTPSYIYDGITNDKKKCIQEILNSQMQKKPIEKLKTPAGDGCKNLLYCLFSNIPKYVSFKKRPTRFERIKQTFRNVLPNSTSTFTSTSHDIYQPLSDGNENRYEVKNQNQNLPFKCNIQFKKRRQILNMSIVWDPKIQSFRIECDFRIIPINVEKETNNNMSSLFPNFNVVNGSTIIELENLPGFITYMQTKYNVIVDTSKTFQPRPQNEIKKHNINYNEEVWNYVFKQNQHLQSYHNSYNWFTRPYEGYMENDSISQLFV
jgi:hypothetical protein